MPGGGAVRRACRSVGLLVAGSLVAGNLALGLPAGAVPRTGHDHGLPSRSDIAKAHGRARRDAEAVGAAKARLAAADGRLASLRSAAETAIERYNGERVKLREARRRYRTAERHLRGATGALHAKRSAVATQASVSYMRDGGLPVAALLVGGDGGPQGFLDRAAISHEFGSRQLGALGRLRAAEVVAGVFGRQSHRALAAERGAAERAVADKARAQQAVHAQRDYVHTLAGTRRRLTERLRTARSHTDALRRRRRVARAARAARAAGRAAGHGAPRHGAAAKRAGPSGATPAAARTHRTPGDIAADWALTQLGKPYVWAAAGPDAYDCSGLTMRAWQHAGVRLDHWTGTQWTSGPHVPIDRLHRGDLVFFATDTAKPATIHHVGIYLGKGRMVEAPYTGANVRISGIRRPDLIGATRPAG